MVAKPKHVEGEAVLYARLVEAAQSIDENFTAQGKQEGNQAYMQRLADCINDIDEDGWPKLDEDIQTWFNAAVAAADAKEDIEYPAGYQPIEATAESAPRKALVRKVTAPTPPTAAEEVDATNAEDETEVAPRNEVLAQLERGASKKAAAPAATVTNGSMASVLAKALGMEPDDPRVVAALKAAAKAAPPEKKKKTELGAVGLIQQYMVQNPDATKEQVKKHLAKHNRNDVAESTIAVTRGGTLAVLRFAREAGLIAE